MKSVSASEIGISVWMDEALIPFLTMGCPILHEYTSTTPAQRYSHVTPHTYELRDAHHRIHGSDRHSDSRLSYPPRRRWMRSKNTLSVDPSLVRTSPTLHGFKGSEGSNRSAGHFH